MKHFSIELQIITPISAQTIELSFTYKGELCHQYWLMPWETGLSTTIEFTIQTEDEHLDIQHFLITNNVLHDYLLIETCKVDNIIQNMPRNKKIAKTDVLTFPLKDLLDFDMGKFPVIKFTDLQKDVLLSHAYICDNYHYISGSDAERSAFTIDQNQSYFEVKVELFSKNIALPAKSLKFKYKDQTLICDGDNPPKSEDIYSLQKKISQSFMPAQEVDTNSGIKDKIDISIAMKPLLNKMNNYSVLKIEGLPEFFHNDKMFYSNGAYFITSKDFNDLTFSSSQEILQDIILTAHLYQEDTQIPLQSFELCLQPLIKQTAETDYSYQLNSKKSA